MLKENETENEESVLVRYIAAASEENKIKTFRTNACPSFAIGL
jgi:hypothetical protein